MRHEPSRLVLNAKRALQLMAATAFLAGANQVHRLHPLVKRYFAALEYRADRCSELLAAILALVHAGTMRFAVQRVVRANCAAMGTYWTIRPADCFKVLARYVGVLELRLVQDRVGHDISPGV